MRLTKREFRREALYRLAAAAADGQRARGELTDSEYAAVCAELRRRFRPLLAALLSGENPR